MRKSQMYVESGEISRLDFGNYYPDTSSGEIVFSPFPKVDKFNASEVDLPSMIEAGVSPKAAHSRSASAFEANENLKNLSNSLSTED